jgi:hypothetical protein
LHSKDAIHQVMREIGPVLDLMQVSAYGERDAWLVAFGGGAVFDIEYDAGLNRLVMTGVIGEVAEHARSRVYEVLLQYNYVWTETGGVRMALDGTPGRVVMMFELPAAEVHLALLGEVLMNMAQVRNTWRHILQDHSDAAASTGAVAGAGSGLGHELLGRT